MDVNDRAREEWVADTTPRERVRSIMRRTYDSESVSTIAERALVSSEVARENLDGLADGGFVEEVDGGRYRRSPESVTREHAEQIIENVDDEMLERRIEELRERVRNGTGSETERRNLRFAEAALEFAEDNNE